MDSVLNQVVLNKLYNTIRYEMRAEDEYKKMEWREFKKHLHEEFLLKKMELENRLLEEQMEREEFDEEQEEREEDIRQQYKELYAKMDAEEQEEQEEPVKPKRKRRTKKEMEALRNGE